MNSSPRRGGRAVQKLSTARPTNMEDNLIRRLYSFYPSFPDASCRPCFVVDLEAFRHTLYRKSVRSSSEFNMPRSDRDTLQFSLSFVLKLDRSISHGY